MTRTKWKQVSYHVYLSAPHWDRDRRKRPANDAAAKRLRALLQSWGLRVICPAAQWHTLDKKGRWRHDRNVSYVKALRSAATVVAMARGMESMQVQADVFNAQVFYKPLLLITEKQAERIKPWFLRMLQTERPWDSIFKPGPMPRVVGRGESNAIVERKFP